MIKIDEITKVLRNNNIEFIWCSDSILRISASFEDKKSKHISC